MVRAAAEPDGDTIFIAALDSFKDLNVAVWDGNAWSDSRELDTTSNTTEGQALDVAWEQAGEDVLVAWGSGSASSNISYFTWRKGTALTDHAVRTGPGFGDQVQNVRLLPVSGSQRIIALVMCTGRQLRYSVWSGSGFGSNPAVDVDPKLSGGDVNYEISESGVTYTGGAG